MTELVPADRIEKIVGARRHNTAHVGRAVSGEQTVYILHSHECRDSGIDLRDCLYSIALDRGIEASSWGDHEDRAVLLDVRHRRLIPAADLTADDRGVQLIPEETTDA